MIDSDQFELIDVGNFAQLFCETHIEYTVTRLEACAGDVDVFIVIDREVCAVAGGSAERSDAEHVGDQAKFSSVPSENHGARTGEAGSFLDDVYAIDGAIELILDQAVGPGDAHGLDGRLSAEAKDQGDADVSLLGVTSAGLHLHFGAEGGLQILYADEGDFDPVAIIGVRGCCPQFKSAFCDVNLASAAGGVEIGAGGVDFGGP